ncbi:MAG: hypothetical protein JXA11_12665 [Phycisphaerae bacterium]|nr:hypothetical protein [Phycisphaerae bacterium]
MLRATAPSGKPKRIPAGRVALLEKGQIEVFPTNHIFGILDVDTKKPAFQRVQFLEITQSQHMAAKQSMTNNATFNFLRGIPMASNIFLTSSVRITELSPGVLHCLPASVLYTISHFE